jgi:hypothetical protein
MSVRLRQRAVLRAAELYADACNRLSVYVAGAPKQHSSGWSETFREEFDKRINEVEGAKRLLLMLAKKL